MTKALFNAAKIIDAKAKKNIFLVTGREDATIIGAWFPNSISTVWDSDADLTPLAGCYITVWATKQSSRKNPTKTEESFRAMKFALEDVGVTSIQHIKPTISLKGMDHEGAIKYAKENTALAPFIGTPTIDPDEQNREFDEAMLDMQDVIGEPHPDDVMAPDPYDEPDKQPFRCVGFRGNTYYYITEGSRQVISMAAGSHSKANLLSIAPLQYWEKSYPSKKYAADFDMAINALIQTCKRVGPFDPELIRGRGAWWDDDRSVLHTGDKVIVDGKATDLEAFESRFIYERQVRMRSEMSKPLPAREAVKLIQLCERCTWAQPISGKLLAGWIFTAPICGAMRWRSHIWITGSSGSGKSFIMDNLLAKGLQDYALNVQSATTEAGLRQYLGNDALPIIFDEAEAENARSSDRMDHVMELMRQASTDTGARILKGSTGGKATAYSIRSAFAFASIGTAVRQQADKTRICVLSLNVDKRDDASKRFEELKKKFADTMTDEYVQRLHARAFGMIGTIRHNAEIFAQAAEGILGSRRMGDKVGALLAGAYALHSGKEISYSDAKVWLEHQNWEEEQEVGGNSDEVNCLSHLMEHTIKVPSEQRTTIDRSLGELVETAAGRGSDIEISRFDAVATLKRYGIRMTDDDEAIDVSTSHTAIARILRDTPWGRSWGRVLERLPGASKTPHPIRFTAGTRHRAIQIPIGLVIEEKKKQESF